LFGYLFSACALGLLWQVFLSLLFQSSRVCSKMWMTAVSGALQAIMFAK
jgi:hypothetical protein